MRAASSARSAGSWRISTIRPGIAARASGDENTAIVPRTWRATSSANDVGAGVATTVAGNTASCTSSAFDGHRR